MIESSRHEDTKPQLTLRSLSESSKRTGTGSPFSLEMVNHVLQASGQNSIGSRTVRGYGNPSSTGSAFLAIDSNNRMQGWIMDQEYYLEQNRINGSLSSSSNIQNGSTGSPVASIGQVSPLDQDSEDSNYSKRKTGRDPLSHRIIEKRRRDRMNTCLNDLQKLIPSAYLKKGKGRTEKTEIVEMAIKHLKYLEGQAKASCPEDRKLPSGRGREAETVQSRLSGNGQLKPVDSKVDIKLNLTPDDSEDKEPMEISDEPDQPTKAKPTLTSPANVRQRRTPVLQFTGSQLRKMLEADEQQTLKTVPNGSTSPRASLSPSLSVKSISSPVSESLSAYHEKDSSTSRKSYKKEIRERFQATVGNIETVPECRLISETRPRSLSAFAAVTPGGATMNVPPKCFHCHGPQTPSGPLVAGFALHPNGTYYVPIKVDQSLVRRHLGPESTSGNRLLASGQTFPTLHPISICVSFPIPNSIWPSVSQEIRASH
ncbi:Hairy and enhancer of split-related protein HELT [Halotydeus destructor]|nr:Hairy and enhancer of split-related protein HELT [Halotydeus destructor]